MTVLPFNDSVLWRYHEELLNIEDLIIFIILFLFQKDFIVTYDNISIISRI